MRTIINLFAVCAVLCSSTFGACSLPGTHSSATNFATNLEGTLDTRTGTWGKAGYVINKLTFTPPAGCRVRILRVYGDFLVWPLSNTPGPSAGALWGLQTTDAEGSRWIDYAADNTMVYLQVATGGAPTRAPFDFDVKQGGLLGPDNVLVSKIAIFLNLLGLIHCEPSFVLVYRFE